MAELNSSQNAIAKFKKTISKQRTKKRFKIK